MNGSEILCLPELDEVDEEGGTVVVIVIVV